MITGILGFAIFLLCATTFVIVGYCVVCAREIRHPRRLSTGWALALSRASEPDSIDRDFRHWTLELEDGTALPVWEARTRPEAEAPASATVVVLHGWGNSRTHSIERLEALVESMQDTPALRLIFLDLRGHGDASSGPTTLGIKELDDLGALLETLPTEQPTILMGHSMGAVLAIRAAARWPERINGVLALAPYRWILTPINRTFALREQPGVRLTRLIARLCTSGEFMRVDTAEDAARMPQPLEVLTGAEDPICPPEEGAQIAANAPLGRFDSVDSVKHSNLHQHAPKQLTESLQRLVRAALDDACTTAHSAKSEAPPFRDASHD